MSLMACCGNIAKTGCIYKQLNFWQYCWNSDNIATVFSVKQETVYTIMHTYISIDRIELIFKIQILLLKILFPNVIDN